MAYYIETCFRVWVWVFQALLDEYRQMNRNFSKHTFVYVRPAKIQISMRSRAVW